MSDGNLAELIAAEIPTRDDVLFGVEGAMRQAAQREELFRDGFRWRLGHFTRGAHRRHRSFPHWCPGEGCAIARWIYERVR